MAEEAAKEINETNAATEDMDLVAGGDENVESKAKRARKEEEEGDGNGDVSKKQKVDENEKSMEEERLEEKSGGAEEKNGSGRVNLGPKVFGSSVEMFDYFYKILHFWPPNLNVNKYEYMVLLELLKQGHAEADRKIGGGVQAIQVQYHPSWKSRCFYLIREDESVEDFSFRKCVDQILALPEDMKNKVDANKALGGGGGKGRGGKSGHGRGGHGRGRGGKWRN
ncbi:protein EMBRYO DEFECTIVE 514 [Pistacia vera]|uniref:protein EMBRYO DEFECTIVE 514 n=1 Tax=Pistacia vera TaxID=55513 RepID=UPI00126355FB|nr:protein EMBRYO DEFECTIVE 514 [Pistacia vera]